MAIPFTRYKNQGAFHWEQTETNSIRRFNAYLQARYERSLLELGSIHGKTVIDLGAGDGAFSSLLAKQGAHTLLVEQQEAGLSIAKEMFVKRGLSGEFIRAEANDVPLPSGCADAVVCNELIEHLDDPAGLLIEIHRLLKPGGTLVLTTPYKLGEIPMSEFHVREFTPSELKALALPYFDEIRIIETHHIFWFSLYGYRFRALRRMQVGRYFINILSLWFRSNPFLRDATNREKRDYFVQLTLRAVRKK